MDDDDWRSWKNGKHDNRYHGVKRHSGQRSYKIPVIVSVIIIVIILGYFVYQTYGTPQVIQNEASKAIQNTGNTIQQITSQGQQSLSHLQTSVTSSINKDRTPVAVYDCSSFVRTDLKTIDSTCYDANRSYKQFKFNLPSALEQGLQSNVALPNVKSKLYQYGTNDFTIWLSDQLGGKNYTVTLWQLP